MNLLKELEPYNRDLDNWKSGHGFSNQEKLHKLADIWKRFQEFNKVEIYGNTNHIIPDMDWSCRGCINTMLRLLFNWREKLEVEAPTYFQGVPSKKPLKPLKPKKIEIVDYRKLKWSDLKKFAAEKGVKLVSKKKKDQILEELDKLLK